MLVWGGLNVQILKTTWTATRIPVGAAAQRARECMWSVRRHCSCTLHSLVQAGKMQYCNWWTQPHTPTGTAKCKAEPGHDLSPYFQTALVSCIDFFFHFEHAFGEKSCAWDLTLQRTDPHIESNQLPVKHHCTYILLTLFFCFLKILWVLFSCIKKKDNSKHSPLQLRWVLGIS